MTDKGKPLFYPTKPTDEYPNGIWTDKPEVWSEKEYQLSKQEQQILTDAHRKSVKKIDETFWKPIEWIDISHAPKDGTMLVLGKFIKNPPPYKPALGYITEGYWSEESEQWEKWQGIYVKDPTHFIKYNPPSM